MGSRGFLRLLSVTRDVLEPLPQPPDPHSSDMTHSPQFAEFFEAPRPARCEIIDIPKLGPLPCLRAHGTRTRCSHYHLINFKSVLLDHCGGGGSPFIRAFSFHQRADGICGTRIDQDPIIIPCLRRQALATVGPRSTPFLAAAQSSDERSNMTCISKARNRSIQRCLKMSKRIFSCNCNCKEKEGAYRQRITLPLPLVLRSMLDSWPLPIRESITTRSYNLGEQRNHGQSFSPNVLLLFLSFSSKLTSTRHRMLGHGYRPCVQVQLDPKTCCKFKQRIRHTLPCLNFPFFSSVGYGSSTLMFFGVVEALGDAGSSTLS